MVNAVKTVATGARIFPANLFDHAQADGNQRKNLLPSSLSPREMEVLSYVAAGYDNLKISAHLNICERTVKAHVSALYRKLRMENLSILSWCSSGLQFGLHLPSPLMGSGTELAFASDGRSGCRAGRGHAGARGDGCANGRAWPRRAAPRPALHRGDWVARVGVPHRRGRALRAVGSTGWVVAYSFVLSYAVSDVLGAFRGLSGLAQALMVVFVFAAQWVYWTACEVAFGGRGGRTLGKRAVRIRVAARTNRRRVPWTACSETSPASSTSSRRSTSWE